MKSKGSAYTYTEEDTRIIDGCLYQETGRSGYKLLQLKE